MPLVVECGSEIAFEGGPEPVVALGNRRAIECVVANLIDNALRAELMGGAVVVRVLVDAVVEVVDHGDGVAPSDREMIFEPFWRKSESEARHRPRPRRRQGAHGEDVRAHRHRRDAGWRRDFSPVVQTRLARNRFWLSALVALGGEMHACFGGTAAQDRHGDDGLGIDRSQCEIDGATRRMAAGGATEIDKHRRLRLRSISHQKHRTLLRALPRRSAPCKPTTRIGAAHAPTSIRRLSRQSGTELPRTHLSPVTLFSEGRIIKHAGPMFRARGSLPK